MAYLKDTEMSLTPGLNPVIKESRSGLSMIVEQIIMQVMEKVSGRTIFSEHEPMHTPETNSRRELPPTPDLSPIIRPMELESPLPLSETRTSVVLDKTQDIILELLLHSAEIYLIQKELSKTRRIAQVSLKKNMERGPKEISLKLHIKID